MASQQTSTTTADVLPELLPMLQEHFTLTPNHARPLSNRIVAERFDPTTRASQPVTEREYVEFVYWQGVKGPHLRPVWRFRVNGVSLRFNDAFEQWRNRGLRHASPCAGCDGTVWNDAHRAPQPLCRECRSQSGWCVRERCTCATAYKNRGCRCDGCRAWNTAKHRRLRATRRNPVSSTATNNQEKTVVLPPVGSPSRTRNGVTRNGVASVYPGWTGAWWLPEELRTVLEQYEAAWGAGEDHLSEVTAPVWDRTCLATSTEDGGR